MIEPKRPSNENFRLQALYRYNVLDTAEEEEFDMLVELASRICETPISLITLVDEERQWFKARLGVDAEETERRLSFCAHAILQNDLLVVGDASQDERFFDNPLVASDPAVRFYAGAQIRSSDGHKLGTLCVLDTKPRELNWHQASALKILSAQASRLLELRYLKSLLPNTLQSANPGQPRHAVDELMAQQAAYFLQAEESLLEPLRTGRFTKKELTNAYYQSKLLLNANKRFTNMVSLYHRERSKDPEKMNLGALLEKVHASLQTSLDKKISMPGIRLAPQTVIIRNGDAARQMLEKLFEILMVDLDTSFTIEAFQRENKLELRCVLPTTKLEGYTEPAKWSVALNNPLATIGAYSLQLLSWMVSSIAGTLEVHNESRGSTVFFALPTA